VSRNAIKDRVTITIDNTFKMLLVALPQGVLSAVLWILYSAWNDLTFRRGFFG
jgi:hypothetical protein